jgi:amicoumacin kinase
VNPAAAFARWQLDASPAPALLRRSTNEIWTAHRAGASIYLRVTPSTHRDAGQVLAEVTWMQQLQAAGVRVVRPLASAQGHLVESIEGASVTAFTAAPGRHARKPDDCRPPVLRSWAALLADLHRAVRTDGAPPGRFPWHQDRVFQVAQQASDASTRPAQQLLKDLTAWMQGLPTAADGFGLTHADLHLGNLSVDEGAGDAVTAYDFDDSCLHWFAHDLAVGITSLRKASWENPGRFDANAAEACLCEGYFAGAGLADVWRVRLEAFIAYRIALSACWASRSRELGELDPELDAWFERSLPWWLGQLQDRRGEIVRAMSV